MTGLKKYIRILNMDILNTGMEQLLKDFRSGCLFTLNVDHAMMLQSDREFYDAYLAAEFRVLDSRVIDLTWRLRNEPFLTHIAGVEFFQRYCEYYRNNETIRLFILGGVENDDDRIRTILNERYGRQIVCDAYSPSFNLLNDPDETDRIIERINGSSATVLVVGLGAPKQEKWIHRNRNRLPNITVFMGLGATLDYLTGRQRRAPQWMQTIGLEWFYRLAKEPKRLAKRYLIRDLPFFYYFILDVLGRYQNPFERPNE